MKTFFRKSRYIVLLALSLTLFLSCQDDDNGSIEFQANHSHLTTTKVNLYDFPEVIDHLSTKLSQDFQIEVDHSSYHTASRMGSNITVLTVDPTNASQSTDENEKSNFSALAEVEMMDQGGEFKFATYNVVVSEYGKEYYTFIVEYEYDKDWVASQTVGDYDYTTFTGFVRYYNVYGLFVRELTYTNGAVTAGFGIDPCTGQDDGDDLPGGGGDGPTVVITCGCDPGHNGGNSNPVCSCTLPDIITIYNFGPPDGDVSKDGLRSADPCGPGPGGGGDGDGGGGGDILDLPDECFLPNGDPIDCENPNIPLTPEELQENYFSLLTALASFIGDTFWTDYVDEMVWLGDNKQDATDLLYHLMNDDYSDNAYIFAFGAIELLMQGQIETINEIPVIVAPQFPINDIVEFLECFDSSQPATVTIYADQPVPNAFDAYTIVNGSAVVGHSFLSIDQNGNNSVLGYYPVGEPNPLLPNDPAILGQDDHRDFDTSITVEISGAVLQQVLDYIINFEPLYNLNDYNCTDFTIEIANIMGLGFPECNGSWLVGSGSNPGAMGQFIRTITPSDTVSVNTTGGNPSPTDKNC